MPPFRLAVDQPVCQCGGTRFTGLQYQGTPHDYDGVSVWICASCDRHYGRWSRRELQAGEYEPRYGGQDRGKP